MRSKSLVAVATVALLFTVIGCSKKDSADVKTTVPVTDEVDDTAIECPEQLVVDAVNDEFDKVSSGEDADVESAYDVMSDYIPAKLEADFEVVSDAAVRAADLISGIDPTKSESELTASEKADFNEARDLMKSAEVEDAQDNVKEYFREECPDIVFSEESASTTTTEQASGIGLCPTAGEVAQLTAIVARLGDPAAVVDAALLSDIETLYAVQGAYVPDDLADDLALSYIAAIPAFTSLEGLPLAALNDPSALSAEDQARVAAFITVLQAPELEAASDAVDEYFEDTCDLDL